MLGHLLPTRPVQPNFKPCLDDDGGTVLVHTVCDNTSRTSSDARPKQICCCICCREDGLTRCRCNQNKVFYCGSECQEAGWGAHKEACCWRQQCQHKKLKTKFEKLKKKFERLQRRQWPSNRSMQSLGSGSSSSDSD
jgi:hypothetical protein